MRTTEEVARKLTRASQKFFYDVNTKLVWPEAVDTSQWTMSPELVSLYGTDVWEEMSDVQRKKLAFHELAGFFSLILHGERPLLEGMSHRLYTLEKNLHVLEYMHHFLDEENKHMMMFSGYLRRYVGKVYPEKKIALARPLAKGEEDVSFFAKVLVVEELSDYYNVVMGQDERLPKIIRDVNWTHHVDEARHVHFGRRYLAELWERYTPAWSEEQVASFRSWLVDYVNASWRDFYNPSAYKDAGLADPYAAREAALKSERCRAHRQLCSERFLQNLVDSGILPEIPTLQ
jgi:P-aminobenzoate N-oxygenase AurF